ncbi:MAG: cell division protein FtsZ [Alphaproteobacteria bacterium]|nr:cell division protein FtsZ [Alphaproteobacteria bacterium]
MSIDLAVADTPITHLKPRISVIGVGGGGGNAVNNMIAKKLEGVDFVVANTDSQALAHSSASRKIQLGLAITQGLGAGARPEIGKMAAEEAKDEITKELEGSNMVFITAGMGGGTGSGAAPVVAKIAKEMGILTVGVVTKPFDFEGKKRMENAEEALKRFTEEVDSIIVIPNQNLFRIADKNTTLPEAFMMADNVLYSGVRSITDLMMMPGLINLDFADIKSIMEDKGKAIMGTGEAEGENRARVAAEHALSNPLLDDCSMKGAKGVLINITGGSDMTLMEIAEASNIIKEEVDDDANIIFGSSMDETLNGKLRVSIVVTGIDGRNVKEDAKEGRVAAYIDESYAPASKEDNNFAINSEDIDYNLERFSANAASDQTEFDASEENKEEEPVVATTDEPETTGLESMDFAPSNEDEPTETISDSDSMPEMPQASALFSAIINNTPISEKQDLAEKSISEFLPSEQDIFSTDAKIDTLAEEPVLFPEQDEEIFAEKREEPVAEPVAETTTKAKFIDKILGISRARKNRKDQPSVVATAPHFDTEEDSIDYSNDDIDNLDIPSFLRRR